MAKLADAQDLESCGQPCKFKSCRRHHVPAELLCGDILFYADDKIWGEARLCRRSADTTADLTALGLGCQPCALLKVKILSAAPRPRKAHIARGCQINGNLYTSYACGSSSRKSRYTAIFGSPYSISIIICLTRCLNLSSKRLIPFKLSPRRITLRGHSFFVRNYRKSFMI